MPSFINAQFVASVVTIFAMVHVILLGCAYCIWLERKLSAWVQDRCGPNRVGPWGLLQPIADGIKFLLKEDYTPPNVDRFLFTLAPMIAVATALIGFVVIPWGGGLDLSTLPFGLAATLGVEDQTVQVVGADVNIGILYLLAVGSLGVYGVSLGGWASNSKYSFFGGLRASAQMVSYEIPLGLSLLAVILVAGTIEPSGLMARQKELGWFILQMPLAALVYYVCRLAECNRAPFDVAECEQELVGGFHTEYSSMRFALFFLGEYAHMITGAALFALVFLGGWSVNPFPWGPDLPAEGGIGLIVLQVGVMLFKVFLVICLDMFVRWTIPRFRWDQIMKLSWTGLIPVAMLVVLAASVVVYAGLERWSWIASLGCLGLIWALLPLLPRQPSGNERVPLIGSRFSPLREAEVTTAPSEPLAVADSPLAR